MDVPWTDVIQTVGALAAAAAAVASWFSVAQARSITEAAGLPELHGQGLHARSELGSHYLMLSVHNAGGATAKAVGFVLIGGDTYSHGFIGDGFLKSGETVRVSTEIPFAHTDDDAIGVVFCRDLRERTLVWTLAGDRKDLGRAPADGSRTILDLLTAHYPDVDTTKLRRARFKAARG